MCIDAPESTTNSRSSGFRLDAGRHLFSEGEKNAALFFSSKFKTLLASFHAASRAPCSCHSVSSCDRSSNFGAFGFRWWGSPGQILLSDRFWSRTFESRNTALVSRTHRTGISAVELFRKIDEDLGGSVSWDTQTKFVSLTKATALLSPFLQTFFAGLFYKPAVCEGALITENESLFCLVEQALWRMPLFTKWIRTSTSWMFPARQTRYFSGRIFVPGTSTLILIVLEIACV